LIATGSRTAIFKKYGEASRITDSGRNNFSADWTIAGGKLPSCTNGAWANCPPFGAEYDAMSLSNYTKDMSQFDFLLKVSVFSSFQDQEKASGVSVYLTSLTRRKAAAVADFQSLIDEGARIISQTATTAVAPKL
jgi:hypothetical protein